MHRQFRGETIYMAENDVHFPQLTVGQTLNFAAKARAPRDFTFPGITRTKYAECMVEVTMATFGLRHTVNSKVGLISGGERKRVFDKVTVLYEGRQIYFGPCHEAKAYFINLGFECAPRQTTADFLTSLTSPSERRIRPDFEARTPRTAEEFVIIWKRSNAYAKLRHEIREYEARYPLGGKSVNDFTAARRARQAKYQYALCHPFTEAAASAIVDLPFKVANSISFNIVLYFMTNLRRTSGAFFTFLLFSFCITLSLSMVFRTIGASSRTLAQALAPAAIFILSLMVYTGFVIPINDMVPWFRWINNIDPIAYAYESLMINEFDGREFPCSTFVPSGPEYSDVGRFDHTCAVTSVFHWRDICYDIKIKKENRRILNHVDGWVKPGSLTALMGPSGAGKTTLLDVLATRDTQDFHLETMTVREALRFNALMCQPKTTSKKDKLAYVEKVIKLLGMEYYSNAIVGVPGEGS
ncbi:putative ABC transporter CDR4 [Glarea lozoyensis 74030]|uniref:Putative ABC transporter CDR4 n=1 Tax=Glarea lozoyensis (strain ATCC 74030 / MF5533) TaxID=1104152 RepID=H0EFV6_GLAL7|nr:putative ABC transporter CDR4 [Glarea lozoyensis 74030]